DATPHSHVVPLDLIVGRPLVAFAQPIAEADRVQPTDRFHRVVLGVLSLDLALEPAAGAERARVRAHQFLVLSLRDLGLAQEKALCDLDPAPWLLIVRRVPVTLRSPHPEITRSHVNHADDRRLAIAL